MDGFCRACLNTFDDPLDLLRYTEERRRLFVYSTGLQVKRNDVFTFQLCKECQFGMKTSCKFKKMCRTSDKKIKSYLALKDVDEGMDFNTFLKRHENSLTFRLPLLSGGSTPANQKAKDDDNESTCTSIQNFMTDLLRAEEIPDSEAKIIRQVIEEEADVLEDSLDSHWLDDDVSDDEFQLDMSLSRFSTPRSTNHDRMGSPVPRNVTSADITSGEDYDNIPVDGTLKKLTVPIQQHSTNSKPKVVGASVENETKKMRCVIDKNLEKALKDESYNEFSLEELIASPVYPSKSGASTPTIKQIIFGDKIKDGKKSKSPKFDSDLHLLMGKLGKTQKSQEVFQKGKYGLEATLGKGKVSLEKNELGMKQNSKIETEKEDLEKITEGKIIDLGMYSAGKILQEKLDLVKGKLFEEKMALTKSGKLFKDELEKLYEGKFNLDDFDIEEVEEPNPGLQNVNVVNQDNGKQEDADLNIEKLLEDRPVEPDNNENNADELDLELFGEPDAEYLEEDSDEGIVEEFINAEREKLANAEMKKRAMASLMNAAQINDAELTDLLQEAYDSNVELMKGKKLPQSPQKCVEILTKMLSPVENKYCVTNFYCKMCNKKFINLKALKIHFAKLHKYKFAEQKKPWKVKVKICDVCGKSFTNTKSLVRHLENHNRPDEYSCEKCSLKFKTENALNTHKRTHMSMAALKLKKKINAANAKYVCKVCGAVSTSSSNHVLHERRHAKSYSLHCEHCGRGFYRATELAVHTRKHTGERPYPCQYCKKTFSRRDGLNRHMKNHTDEKLFSCQYCNRKFAKSYDVKFHQKNHKNCLMLRRN